MGRRCKSYTKILNIFERFSFMKHRLSIFSSSVQTEEKLNVINLLKVYGNYTAYMKFSLLLDNIYDYFIPRRPTMWFHTFSPLCCVISNLHVLLPMRP